jgi:hypothetical protein
MRGVRRIEHPRVSGVEYLVIGPTLLTSYQ